MSSIVSHHPRRTAFFSVAIWSVLALLIPDIEAQDSTSLTAEPVSSGVGQQHFPAKPQSLPSVLYLDGGPGAVWFHIGVLDAIEQFRIPIDTIVGTSWGAWIGTLWSAGWGPEQIAAFLREDDIAGLEFRDFLSPLPDRSYENFLSTFQLAERVQGGYSGWESDWRFYGAEQGTPHFERYQTDTDSLNRLGAWYRFRIQESLLREPPGQSAPVKIRNCDNTSISTDTESQVLLTLPLSGNGHSGEICQPRLPEEDRNDILLIAATPVPVRSSGVIADPWRRRIQNERRSYWDKQKHGILVRPYHLEQDSLRSLSALRQAGFNAFKTRLGELSPLAGRLHSYPPPRNHPPQYVFQPVLDSVESVYHAHMRSFWPPDTGLLAPRHFFEEAGRSGHYDSLSLQMDDESFLQIQGKGTPRMALGGGAFGSAYHGLNAAGWGEWVWINQFSYQVRSELLYGQSVRGARPVLRMDHLWGPDGYFALQGDFINISPLKSALNTETHFNRLTREERRNLILETGYRLDSASRIQASVTMEKSHYQTGIWKIVNQARSSDNQLKPVSVSGLHLQAAWTDSTIGYHRWLSRSGRLMRLSAGFHSIGVQTFGQSSAPLYFSTQGEWEQTFSAGRLATIALGAEGGINMRRGAGGRVLYPAALEIIPDQITDPALDNRYRLRMGISPWQQEWWTGQNTSHHYALTRLTTSLQVAGTGVFLISGYIRDFESNPWSIYGENRLFIEPFLRLSHRSLDVRMGMHRQVGWKEAEELRHIRNYQYFLQLGSFLF